MTHDHNRQTAGELTASCAGPPEDGLDTIDPAVLAAFRDGEGAFDFTVKLIDAFTGDAAACVAAIGRALQRQDLAALQATAHRLKGGAMTIGATRLAALSGRLEGGAGNDSTHEAATPALVAAIEGELVRVRHALARERHASLERPRL